MIRRPIMFAAVAAFAGPLVHGQTSELVLNDGRVFPSGRVVDISGESATIAHSAGVIMVPVDAVPLDVLARAYERIQQRRQERTTAAKEVVARDEARHAARAAAVEAAASRTFTLKATGDAGPTTGRENACIVMSNPRATGTGFIVRQQNGFVLVSNQHVISGPAPHKYERPDGTALRPLTGIIANDRDLVAFQLDQSFTDYLEMEPDVNAVELGEDVIIYGNSLGQGVRISNAKLLSKSRSQIEISGGIVPGNSGGPILRAKTGRVIGVSTYATVPQSRGRTIDQIIAASGVPTVRFYGVRIDTLADVAEFDLRLFLGESNSMDADERRLQQALCLLALMHQKLGGSRSQRVAELAGRADRDVVEAVRLLRWSTFYPGTVSAIDLDAFRRSAGRFFDLGPRPRSYIHAERWRAIAEDRAGLVDLFNDLLRSVPVR
jgi:hypothetical protein